MAVDFEHSARFSDGDLPTRSNALHGDLADLIKDYMAKRINKTLTIAEGMDFYNLVVEIYARAQNIPLKMVKEHWADCNVTISQFYLPDKGECAIPSCTERCAPNLYKQTHFMYSPKHPRFSHHPLPIDSLIQFPEPDLDAITSGRVSYSAFDLRYFLWSYKALWDCHTKIGQLEWADYEVDQTRVFRKFADTRVVDRAELEKRGWKEPELRKLKRGHLARTDFGLMRVTISVNAYLAANERGVWASHAHTTGRISGGSWFASKFVPFENISPRSQEQVIMLQSEPLKDNEPDSGEISDEVLKEELNVPPLDSTITPSKMATPTTIQYQRALERGQQKAALKENRETNLKSVLSGKTIVDGETGQEVSLSPLIAKYLAEQKTFLQPPVAVQALFVAESPGGGADADSTDASTVANKTEPVEDCPKLEVQKPLVGKMIIKRPRRVAKPYDRRRRPVPSHNPKIKLPDETPEESSNATNLLVAFGTNSPTPSASSAPDSSISTTRKMSTRSGSTQRVDKMLETINSIAKGTGDKKLDSDLSKALSLLAEIVSRIDVGMENEKRRNAERNNDLIRNVQGMFDHLQLDVHATVTENASKPVLISEDQINKIQVSILEKVAEMCTEQSFEMLKQQQIALSCKRLTGRIPQTGWDGAVNELGQEELDRIRQIEPQERAWVGKEKPTFAEMVPAFAMIDPDLVPPQGNPLLQDPIIQGNGGANEIKNHLVAQIVKYSAGASEAVLQKHSVLELQNFLKAVRGEHSADPSPEVPVLRRIRPRTPNYVEDSPDSSRSSSIDSSESYSWDFDARSRPRRRHRAGNRRRRRRYGITYGRHHRTVRSAERQSPVAAQLQLATSNASTVPFIAETTNTGANVAAQPNENEPVAAQSTAISIAPQAQTTVQTSVSAVQTSVPAVQTSVHAVQTSVPLTSALLQSESPQVMPTEPKNEISSQTGQSRAPSPLLALPKEPPEPTYYGPFHSNERATEVNSAEEVSAPTHTIIEEGSLLEEKKKELAETRKDRDYAVKQVQLLCTSGANPDDVQTEINTIEDLEAKIAQLATELGEEAIEGELVRPTPPPINPRKRRTVAQLPTYKQPRFITPPPKLQTDPETQATLQSMASWYYPQVQYPYRPQAPQETRPSINPITGRMQVGSPNPTHNLNTPRPPTPYPVPYVPQGYVPQASVRPEIAISQSENRPIENIENSATEPPNVARQGSTATIDRWLNDRKNTLFAEIPGTQAEGGLEEEQDYQIEQMSFNVDSDFDLDTGSVGEGDVNEDVELTTAETEDYMAATSSPPTNLKIVPLNATKPTKAMSYYPQSLIDAAKENVGYDISFKDTFGIDVRKPIVNRNGRKTPFMEQTGKITAKIMYFLLEQMWTNARYSYVKKIFARQWSNCIGRNTGFKHPCEYNSDFRHVLIRGAYEWAICLMCPPYKKGPNTWQKQYIQAFKIQMSNKLALAKFRKKRKP